MRLALFSNSARKVPRQPRLADARPRRTQPLPRPSPPFLPAPTPPQPNSISLVRARTIDVFPYAQASSRPYLAASPTPARPRLRALGKAGKLLRPPKILPDQIAPPSCRAVSLRNLSVVRRMPGLPKPRCGKVCSAVSPRRRDLLGCTLADSKIAPTTAIPVASLPHHDKFFRRLQPVPKPALFDHV